MLSVELYYRHYIAYQLIETEAMLFSEFDALLLCKEQESNLGKVLGVMSAKCTNQTFKMCSNYFTSTFFKLLLG